MFYKIRNIEKCSALASTVNSASSWREYVLTDFRTRQPKTRKADQTALNTERAMNTTYNLDTDLYSLLLELVKDFCFKLFSIRTFFMN